MYDYFTCLSDYLTHSVKNHAHKIALICAENFYTYKQIDEFSDQLASHLQYLGLQKGDRLTICAENSSAAIIAFWAGVKCGGVVSLINPQTSVEKICFIVKDSGARIVIAPSELIDRLLTQVSITPVMIDKEFNTIIFEQHRYQPPNIIDIDLACIIYTSGSTGEPKGVMLTHRNMLAASSSINQYLAHRDSDRILSALPLTFDYGLYQMIMAFSVGACLILEKDFTWPQQFLKKISLHKATILPLVPTMAILLDQYKKYAHYDFSSVRLITNTAGALTLKHIRILRDIFPQAAICSMYGLTECKRCTYLPPDCLQDKPNSVGIAIPNTEFWLVDENNQCVPAGQMGQLVIRGATIMSGYWNRPEETAEKLKPGILPGEKVLYTGDLCYQDEEGFLYFHGRMDEMLKYKGVKISIKEIENTLMTLTGIKEAAVVGVEDEVYGSAIHIFASLEEGINQEVVQSEAINHINKIIKVSHFTILKNLPKTLNGKMNKSALKLMQQNNHYA